MFIFGGLGNYFWIPGCAYFPCYLQHLGAGTFHLHAICNVLELEPFILLASCNIWELEPSILHDMCIYFWSWNLPFGMLFASCCWLLV